jgi:hypothetical protein
MGTKHDKAMVLERSCPSCGKEWLILRWDAFNKKIREDFSVFNGREREANNMKELLNIC